MNLLIDEKFLYVEVRGKYISILSILFLGKSKASFVQIVKSCIFLQQVVKVADFGVARVQTQSGVMTAETGTYRWMAPEVYRLHWTLCHRPYCCFPDIFVQLNLVGINMFSMFSCWCLVDKVGRY